MTTSAKLSCPFCAATNDDLKLIEIDSAQYAVCCEGCGGIGPNDGSEAGAVALWNGAARAAFYGADAPRRQSEAKEERVAA